MIEFLNTQIKPLVTPFTIFFFCFPFFNVFLETFTNVVWVGRQILIHRIVWKRFYYFQSVYMNKIIKHFARRAMIVKHLDSHHELTMMNFKLQR